MTALEVANKLIDAVRKRNRDFILLVEGREIAFITSFSSTDKTIPSIMCSPSLSTRFNGDDEEEIEIYKIDETE